MVPYSIIINLFIIIICFKWTIANNFAKAIYILNNLMHVYHFVLDATDVCNWLKPIFKCPVPIRESYVRDLTFCIIYHHVSECTENVWVRLVFYLKTQKQIVTNVVHYFLSHKTQSLDQYINFITCPQRIHC